MSDSEEVTSAASYFNSAPAPVPVPVPPANQQSQQPFPPAQNQEYLGINNEPPPGTKETTLVQQEKASCSYLV